MLRGIQVFYRFGPCLRLKRFNVMLYMVLF